MRKTAIFTTVLIALAVGITTARAKDETKKESPAAVAFERLKKLAGDWTRDGKLSRTYKVVAGGSTVMETLLPGTPHEMITMYHLDGNDLVLTHYCCFGNQPHMRATTIEEKKLVFELTSGSNMDPAKDPHMHATTFAFTDDDHVKSEWVSFENGAAKDTKTFELTRLKK